MAIATRKILISSYSKRDDLSNISIVDSTINPPGKGEVQVQVLYVSFGGPEVSMRMGLYPMQRKAPLTPGYSFVGRVASNGPNLTKFKPGDTVAAITTYDAGSELINVLESLLLSVPLELSSKDDTLRIVAAISLDWTTAYGMVARAANVQPGQKVFIHGLSGAVGTGIMSLCKMRGAEIYGTASKRNHEALTELGAIPYEYTNKDWIGAMQHIGGAEAVFDPLGFESWDESWSILSPEGILVGYGGNYGVLNGVERPGSPYPAIIKLLLRGLLPLTKKRTNFYYINPGGDAYHSDFSALMDLLMDEKIQVPIKAVWHFDTESIREAHRSWGRLHGMGSMLVQIGKD